VRGGRWEKIGSFLVGRVMLGAEQREGFGLLLVCARGGSGERRKCDLLSPGRAGFQSLHGEDHGFHFFPSISDATRLFLFLAWFPCGTARL
jgi:hypothetical protein